MAFEAFVIRHQQPYTKMTKSTSETFLNGLKKITNSKLQDLQWNWGLTGIENQHPGNFSCNESSVLQSVLLMQYFS